MNVTAACNSTAIARVSEAALGVGHLIIFLVSAAAFLYAFGYNAWFLLRTFRLKFMRRWAFYKFDTLESTVYFERVDFHDFPRLYMHAKAIGLALLVVATADNYQRSFQTSSGAIPWYILSIIGALLLVISLAFPAGRSRRDSKRARDKGQVGDFIYTILVVSGCVAQIVGNIGSSAFIRTTQLTLYSTIVGLCFAAAATTSIFGFIDLLNNIRARLLWATADAKRREELSDEPEKAPDEEATAEEGSSQSHTDSESQDEAKFSQIGENLILSKWCYLAEMVAQNATVLATLLTAFLSGRADAFNWAPECLSLGAILAPLIAIWTLGLGALGVVSFYFLASCTFLRKKIREEYHDSISSSIYDMNHWYKRLVNQALAVVAGCFIGLHALELTSPAVPEAASITCTIVIIAGFFAVSFITTFPGGKDFTRRISANPHLLESWRVLRFRFWLHNLLAIGGLMLIGLGNAGYFIALYCNKVMASATGVLLFVAFVFMILFMSGRGPKRRHLPEGAKARPPSSMLSHVSQPREHPYSDVPHFRQPLVAALPPRRRGMPLRASSPGGALAAYGLRERGAIPRELASDPGPVNEEKIDLPSVGDAKGKEELHSASGSLEGRRSSAPAEEPGKRVPIHIPPPKVQDPTPIQSPEPSVEEGAATNASKKHEEIDPIFSFSWEAIAISLLLVADVLGYVYRNGPQLWGAQDAALKYCW